MKITKRFRFLSLFLWYGTSHLLVCGILVAQADGLADLKNPEFIGYHQNKAVIVHDEGVAMLQVDQRLKESLKLPDTATEVSPNAAYSEMSQIANQWLVSVKSKMNASLARSDRAQVPANTKKQEPAVFTPYEEVRTAYSSVEFDEAYTPELHNGKQLTIKGSITKILEAGEGQYKFILDDFISFEVRSRDRVMSRGFSGDPERVGDYEVGQTISISGLCMGIDAEKYVTFSAARIL